MMQAPLNVAVIIGSTREGRQGDLLASWFLEQVSNSSDIEIDLIDLAAADLPARLPNGIDPAVDTYLSRLDGADAFVIITPEYNHGYPGSLKQAIDLGHDEWFAKPVAFVSYGGVSGGSRAVEQLRQIFPELHAVTVRSTVMLPNFYDHIDSDGVFDPPEICVRAIDEMMDQLNWWGLRLREARAIPMLETS
jgi:NAD(P)H-dependent FMN reductase